MHRFANVLLSRGIARIRVNQKAQSRVITQRVVCSSTPSLAKLAELLMRSCSQFEVNLVDEFCQGGLFVAADSACIYADSRPPFAARQSYTVNLAL